MSWSLQKKKIRHFLYCLFCPKEIIFNIYVLLNVQCIEYTFRIYILLHIKKHCFIHFFACFLKMSSVYPSVGESSPKMGFCTENGKFAETISPLKMSLLVENNYVLSLVSPLLFKYLIILTVNILQKAKSGFPKMGSLKLFLSRAFPAELLERVVKTMTKFKQQMHTSMIVL